MKPTNPFQKRKFPENMILKNKKKINKNPIGRLRMKIHVEDTFKNLIKPMTKYWKSGGFIQSMISWLGFITTFSHCYVYINFFKKCCFFRTKAINSCYSFFFFLISMNCYKFWEKILKLFSFAFFRVCNSEFLSLILPCEYNKLKWNWVSTLW